MKYKGYNILPVYCAGSDMKETRQGELIACKPKKSDIEYYEACEYESPDTWQIREFTLSACKSSIDSLNKLIADSLK